MTREKRRRLISKMEENGGKTLAQWTLNETKSQMSAAVLETEALKNFTIPKLRRSSNKVCLAPCNTDRREYIEMNYALEESRLDISYDLQSSWHFGDMKLVCNDDLEKKYATKRSEMRKEGRHGRELQEHFCFLVLSNSAVLDIYRYGMSTDGNAMKALGNPLMGIYLHRHADVALKFAHQKSMNTSKIMIFKVLFGKVKKIQPIIEKKKVALDPTPNFDCHISRILPSAKDTVDRQVICSSVYLYEYDSFSKPVDKPRHCLPYAVLTARFVGQKNGSAPFITSLRFQCTERSKSSGRDTWTNCTVAKRIGKGKDATIIYQSIRTPAKASACSCQDNCLCTTINSPNNQELVPLTAVNIEEKDKQNWNLSQADSLLQALTPYVLNSFSYLCANMQNINPLEAENIVPVKNLGSNSASENGTLLNTTPFPFVNNSISCSSTVITSRQIKDPRLLKREENVGKQNTELPLSENSPSEVMTECKDKIIKFPIALDIYSCSAENTSVLSDLQQGCLQEMKQANETSWEEYLQKNEMKTAESISLLDTAKEQSIDRLQLNTCVEKLQISKTMAVSLPEIPKAHCLLDFQNEKHMKTKNITPTASEGLFFEDLKMYESQLKEKLRKYSSLLVLSDEDRKAKLEILENLSTQDKACLYSRLKIYDKYYKKYEKQLGLNKSNRKASQIKRPNPKVGISSGQQYITEPMKTSVSSVPSTRFAVKSNVEQAPNDNCSNSCNLGSKLSSSSEDYGEFTTSSRISIEYQNDENEIKTDSCSHNTNSTHHNKEFVNPDQISCHMHSVIVSVKTHHTDVEISSERATCAISTATNEGQNKLASEINQKPQTNKPKSVLENDQGHVSNQCLCIENKDKGIGQENKKTENFKCDEIKEMFGVNIHSQLGKDAWTENDIKTFKREYKADDGIFYCAEKMHKPVTISDMHRKLYPLVDRIGKRFSENEEQVNAHVTSKLKLTNTEKHQKSKTQEIFHLHKADINKNPLETNKINPAIKHTITSTEELNHHSKEIENFSIVMDGLSNIACSVSNTFVHSEIVEKDVCTDKKAIYYPAATLNTMFSVKETHIEEVYSKNMPEYSNDKNFICTTDNVKQLKKNCSSYPILDSERSISSLNVTCQESCAFSKTAVIEDSISCSIDRIPIDEKIQKQLYGTPAFYNVPSTLINKASEAQDALASVANNSLCNIHWDLEDQTCHLENIPFLENKHLGMLNTSIYDCKGKTEVVSEECIIQEIEICERLCLQNLDFGTEIEIPSMDNFSEEHCLVPQDTYSNRDICNEEFSSYQILKDRIDWEGLFGSSREEFTNLSENISMTTKENHCSITGKNIYFPTSTQKKLTESTDMTVFPDVKVTINNELKCVGEMCHHAFPKDFCRCSDESSGTSTDTECINEQSNKNYGNLPCENDIQICVDVPICKLKKENSLQVEKENKMLLGFRKVQCGLQTHETSGKEREAPTDLDDWVPIQETKTIFKTSLSAHDDSAHETENSFTFKKKSSMLLPGPVAVPDTLNNENSCTLAKLKDNYIQTEAKGNRKSKLTRKRHLPATIMNGTVPCRDLVQKSFVHKHFKKYDKKKRLYHSRSSEMFRFLSAGRIKTFSQSEKNIENILKALCDEISLCKSKRLSKKLHRAILYLRKAQKRVHTSLQIVAKVGTKRNSPLPKSYEVICNNLWETCDLEGYNFLKIKKYQCFENLQRKQETKSNREENATGIVYDASVQIPETQALNNKEDQMNKLLSEGNVLDESAKNIVSVLSDKPCLLSDTSLKTHMLNNCTDKSIGDISAELQMSSEDLISLKTDLSNFKVPDKENQVSSADSPKMDVKQMICNSLFNDKDSGLKHTSSPNVLNHFNKISRKKTYIAESTKSPIMLTDEKRNVEMHLVTDTASLSLVPSMFLSLEDGQNKCTKTRQTKLSKNKSNSIDGGQCFKKNTTVGPSLPCIQHKVLQRNPVQQIALNEHSVPNYNSKKKVSCNNCNGFDMETEQSAFFITKLSNILQQADETSSLKILQEHIKFCNKILPSLIKAFEKKQGSPFKNVLVYRKLLVEMNLQPCCESNLKPQAIESFMELQMMMEAIQFIENKISYLEGEPTFRSLLWYDDSLYTELLDGESGYQQQSNFFPSFQEKLKYNALSELQSHHAQLCKLLDSTNETNSSYYMVLKYKREIDECEAVLQNYSDYFDFCLSVPFTCGISLGDTLEDLEILRLSALKLISTCSSSSKDQCDPGKQEHIWFLLEFISAKINFLKNCTYINYEVSLYGLEHLFFDAAKHLLWLRWMQPFGKSTSPIARREFMLKINQCALSKLCELYEYLNEVIFRCENKDKTSTQLQEIDIKNYQRKSSICEKQDKQELFNSPFISHSEIYCVGEILDQAHSADIERLHELTLKCDEQLKSLKTYFQILQENDIDSILITEKNVFEILKGHNTATAILLKPEAVETYIEVMMMYETIHFLKNSVAQKLNQKRFRSILWFDMSLLPELVYCQKKMASFPKDNSKDDIFKIIEHAISEVRDELEIICECTEAINCTYALQLMSKELAELSEIRKLLLKSKSAISTYINFIPYSVSVNYGNTEDELEYNYQQFSTMLETLMLAPKKDLGKMAHIMKVMKTIEHMKYVSSKHVKSALYVLTFQMLQNRKKSILLERNNTQIREIGSKPSHSKPQEPQLCITGTGTSQFLRKRLPCLSESSEAYGESLAYSSVKKQKVNDDSLSKTAEHNDDVCNNKRMKERRYLQREKDLQLVVLSNSKKNHEKNAPVYKKCNQKHSPSPPSHLKDIEGPLYLKNTTYASEDSSTVMQNLDDPSDKTNSNAVNVERQDGVPSIAVECGQNSITALSSEVIPPCQKNCENLSNSTNFSKPVRRIQVHTAHINGNQCDAQQKDKVSPETSNQSVRYSNKLEPETKADAIAYEDDRMSLDEESSCEYQIEIPFMALTNDSMEFCNKESKMAQHSMTEDQNELKTLSSTEASSSISASISNIPVILGIQTARSDFSESTIEEHSMVQCPTANSAILQNNVLQATPEMQSSYMYAAGTYYPPYYSWYVHHQSSNIKNSLSHTYQEVTFEKQQTVPSHTSAVVPGTQIFNYLDPTKTQWNNFSQPFPGYGYYSGCMPPPYNASTFTSNPASSQALLPYSANSGGFWNWGSWQ
uniref:Testis-expressed protein 15 isoform X2 n=1 Tax=Geotrypetes seraphini TaxID=260995 RepID=A0A6P8PA77_GEOSA|nr:testis-expressed protein 15 isoform X2 [Geotrypetes seraphini]